MGRKKSDSFATPPKKQRSPIKKLKLRKITTPERTVYEIIPNDSMANNNITNARSSGKWSSNIYGLEDSYSEKSDDEFQLEQKSTRLLEETEKLVKKFKHTNLNATEKLDFQGLEESLEESNSPIQEEQEKNRTKKFSKKAKKKFFKNSDDSEFEIEHEKQKIAKEAKTCNELEVSNEEDLKNSKKLDGPKMSLISAEKMKPTVEPNIVTEEVPTEPLPTAELKSAQLSGKSNESKENDRPKIIPKTRKRRSTAPEPESSSAEEDDRPFQPLPTGNVAIKLVPIARTHAPKYLEMTPEEFSRILPWLRDKT